MILTNAKYEEALALLRGERQATALLEALRAYARGQYGIEIVDYEFKGRPGLKRLNILLARHEDMHRIGACGGDGDERVRIELAQEFRRLCGQFAVADYAPEDKLFIAFGDMETEIKTRVLEQARPELEQAGDIFPAAGIRQIRAFNGAVHIFCASEAGRCENAANGTEEAVRRYCRSVVAQYDGTDVFGGEIPCIFTSEEMLHREYGNNIFNYFSGLAGASAHH